MSESVPDSIVHGRHVHMAADTKAETEGDGDVANSPEAPAGEDSQGGEAARKHRTVLIAVDGSHPSNQAVQWYLDELHKPNHEVILLHCFELPILHSYQEMCAPEMLTVTLQQEAERTSRLEKNLLRKLKAREIPAKFLATGGGKPGEAIIHEAEEADVDMVVMGTRGHGRLMRTLLGSVSHYVMTHARCPVLVYRAKKGAKPQRSRSSSAKRDGGGTESGDESRKARKDKHKLKEAKED